MRPEENLSTYNLVTIVNLVNDAFDLEGLTEFCFLCFRPVYDEFSDTDHKRTRVRRLVEYAERQGQLDKLLTQIQESNPGKYAQFSDQLLASPSPSNSVPPGPSPSARSTFDQREQHVRTQYNAARDIVQYVINLPPIQDIFQDVGQLLKGHRLLLGILIALQVPLAILFFTFKDRYLIPWWVYLSLVVLLTIMIHGGLNLIKARHSDLPLRPALIQLGISTLIWAGLLSWQVQSVLFPPQFTSQDFGIAIAMFGEGESFRITSRGREISDLLHRQLDEAIRNEPGLATVKLTRLGVVRNIDQGRIDGQRIDAKLVLWGQILERGDATIIHFQVLEAPDLTDNPAIPQTLPLSRRALQTNVGLQGVDSLTIKNEVSLQSLAVTNFSLGLFYYLQLDFQKAVEQFESTLSHTEAVANPTEATNPGLVYYYLGRSYQQLGIFKKISGNV